MDQHRGHYVTPMPGAGAVHPINERLRDELLNVTLFSSLAQARAALANWRVDYNTTRPHSQLGWQTPIVFAATFTARRAPAPRHATSTTPDLPASPARTGSTTARTNSALDKN